MSPLRRLEIAAAVETVTVLVLFGNLLTVHNPSVASLAGPVHGMAYLVVIVLSFSSRGLTRTAKWLSVVPLVGGWLTVRAVAGT
jgi:hypothetical protein